MLFTLTGNKFACIGISTLASIVTPLQVAYAQSQSPAAPSAIANVPLVTETKAEEKLKEGAETVESVGPSSSSTFGPSVPTFEIEANEEGTLATLALGFGGVSADADSKKNGFYKVSRTNLGLKGSFPISGENDGETSFNFGRLGNFEKIEFSLSYYSSNIGTGQGNAVIFISAVKSCIVRNLNKKLAESKDPKLGENIRDFQMAVEQIFLDSNIPIDIYFSENDSPENSPISDNKFNELRNELGTACVNDITNGIKFVGDELGDAEQKRFVDSTFDKSAILFGGIDGNVGRQSFKYINEAAFLEVEETRTPWSLNAFAGLIGSDYNWAIRAQYTYLEKFEAADEGEVCSPPATVCETQNRLTGAIGAPTKNQTSIASLELRKLFQPKLGGKKFPIGIAPQITFDFDESEFGLDVPIYLSRNEAGKLTGGIRIGYRSDMDDIGVGIFIGTPFQVPF